MIAEFEGILSRPTMSPAELAKVLGVSRHTGLRMVRDGEVETIKVGDRRRVATAPNSSPPWP